MNKKWIILNFKERYELLFNQPYVIIWSYAMKTIKDLDEIENDIICERMILFFEDEWFTQDPSRCTLASFVKNINSLKKKPTIEEQYKKILEQK